MSDSRLEKFIYAICSMDVSDLPVPLSRIETLWNCLITGETLDFEPLSRNEKYLMAMLDRYDVSNLPAPMSRGEKLLYKIAVGETDLSDVPDYLSRYEELLKYLIENGGISGDDFEYVLYTLNQSLSTLYLTAEKPVKSAILKGSTEINIKGSLYDDDEIKKDYNIPLVKNNTNYLIKYEIDYTPLDGITEPIFAIGFLSSSTTWWSSNLESQPSKNTVILNSGREPGYFRIIGRREDISTINNVNLLIIEYQQGMENWDIPYFEGIQSVKMPVLKTVGKNLLNISPDTLERVTISGKTGEIIGSDTRCTTKYIKATPNDDLFLKRFITDYKVAVRYYHNDNLVNRELNAYGNFIYDGNLKVDSSDYYNQIRLIFAKSDDSEITPQEVSSQQIMLTSSQNDVFEPYKSNILTVNEDVELRGIGDVQDTLDCLTGELTESIGEIVLDGTQYMDADGRGNYIQVDDMKKVEDYRAIITCDKLPVFYHQWDLPNVENGITGYLDEENKYPGQNWLYIKVNNSIDINEVRQILTQNPITVQYQRVADSIKTVDLTVVNQDNQPTELGTFENVTHVSLEAENLIPEVEMEVATRISTELASASPLMDDISTEQQQLETTVDEQSNNVDATMIATTEIFEETL